MASAWTALVQRPRTASALSNRRLGRTRQKYRGRVLASDPQTVFEEFSRLLVPQPSSTRAPTGAHLKLQKISYQPPSAAFPLLEDVDLEIGRNRMGLICGKSGTGKTTLLQVITGLTEPTSGTVCITQDPTDTEGTSVEGRLGQVGMVFQFPERHFLGHTIRSELTFGWAQTFAAYQINIQRVQSALVSVGLTSFDLEMPTANLSDGFKRRLALAVQLVRQPTILLLDEPLAGLDWKARSDMVQTLKKLKDRCTILVVSHDLKELSCLVDRAWKMTPGGKLHAVHWPSKER